MEDWINFPQPTRAVLARPTLSNALDVRAWLMGIAALVFLMVLVGGATRLTESGLSITEWKPVTGIIPPLSEAEWIKAFDDYKKIPQFKELFPDMDLAGFQVIYGWEWSHRLLARLIGVAFVVPLIWFWVRDRLPPGLKPKLLGILALGALQGVVGWWMVASGLVLRNEVAQERLAIHLLLAALIFVACLWVAGGLGPQVTAKVERGAGRLRFVALTLLALVFVQLGVGALVAGLRAGLIDNTWPLIEGGFAPKADVLWSLSPWWGNLLDNPVTVQFIHRSVAYVIFALAFAHLVDASLNAGRRTRRGAALLFGHICLQIALGVATLVLIGDDWTGAPHIAFALSHQAVGFAVLALATLQARRLAAASTA
jgi:heme a synthase